ncbi:hypothetical protein LTR04_005483 [Oleoguttula sp. CCFEE 6159]|nr:hypothetical protein LTR04_005483 [Oleoguttula sp. CCFEE 6159]
MTVPCGTLLGSTCFYLDIYKYKQRTFLRRNLRQAVEAHQQQTRDLSKSTTTGTPNGTPEQSKRTAGLVDWQYPEERFLDKLFENHGPVLTVDVNYIERSHRRSEQRTKGEIFGDQNLNVACHVDLKLKDGFTKRTVRQEGKRGTILGMEDERGGIKFKVKLDERFQVEIDDLFVPVQQFRAGQTRWCQTQNDRYNLELSISCVDSEAAATLLPLLSASCAGTAGIYDSSLLTVKWSKLPQCVPNDKALSLLRTVDGKKKTMDYGLTVDMRWGKRGKSLIERHNALLLKAYELSSSSSKEMTPLTGDTLPPEAYETTYILILDDRQPGKLKVDGHACLFCNGEDQGGHVLLHLHLVTSHDQFRFIIQTESKTQEFRTIVRRTIRVEAATRVVDTKAASRELEFRWCNPQNPLNVEELLEHGHADWHAEPRRVQPPIGLDCVTSVASRLLQEASDRPAAVRKKHRVPRAPPNVTFFRAVSKRPIKEGELVSESDDDVDEGWLKMKLEEDVRNLDKVSTLAKDFIVQYDTYMQDEQLSADVYMRGTLLRFLRSRRRQLQQSNFRAEFIKTTERLRDDGVITDDLKDLIRQALLELADTNNDISGPSGRPEILSKSTNDGLIAVRKKRVVSRTAHVSRKKRRIFEAGGYGGDGRWRDVFSSDEDGSQSEEVQHRGLNERSQSRRDVLDGTGDHSFSS